MASFQQAKISPHLWFDKEAVEAAEFYTQLFDHSRIVNVTKIDDTPSGSVDVVNFELFGQPFTAISAGPFFTFNESVSFVIHCDDQAEIDRYWTALSQDGGEEGQCGWLKDKFGLSWQIVPRSMDVMMRSHDHDKLARLTQCFLTMTKLEIAALERAFNGK
ncbi:VOC family protein [Photobacterium sp. 2_MG-2023]|uniref:VOC family protein n=1 Tax=unclassified Photobacterium TaxID=2628852 RepID=UPI001C48FC87|nr:MULTISPECIES: VOC family protein [unclassified Photobacterium]MBV7262824.1 VOC family protein [Photobacterium sp. WH24]MDO6582542.1 VOC family protein [Photobacterium sp. 2_MG-2023]